MKDCKLRKVLYTKKYYQPAEYLKETLINKGGWTEDQSIEAYFHMFYQYNEGGDEGYWGEAGAMALIELSDGTIKEVPPTQIRFIDRKEG